MSEANLVICEHCGHTYELDEAFCPACDQPNPLFEELDEDWFESAPPRRSFWRPAIGCFSTFVCVLLIYVIIGLAGAFEGLQERQAIRQQNAEEHYQRGLTYLEQGQLDLAIAEFDLTLTLDSNHTEAREALREAKSLTQAQPTPTSETRKNVAEDLLGDVQELMQQGNWQEAVEVLNQIQDIAPTYKAQQVVELVYLANYELGLRLIAEDDLPQALAAFEAALAARPGDPVVTVEQSKLALYLAAEESWGGDWEQTIALLEQLYGEDAGYLDVRRRLFEAYVAFADALAGQQDWCLAAPRYASALEVSSEAGIEGKYNDADLRCRASLTPTAAPTRVVAAATPGSASTGTAVVSATGTITAASVVSGAGTIVFSRFNEKDLAWEIIGASPGGETTTVLARGASQPAVSPNGRLLAYHSELPESEGLHILNLTTGEDIRSTIFREDVIPQWGGDNLRLVFASQRAGDRRWQVFLGFADGKGDPVTLFDGRTPAWSPDGRWIAYQGTDPEGNNPGIYLIPFEGGPARRLSTHESDRLPRFSPRGDQIVYMSARSGNWDLYVVDLEGGSPRQLTRAASNEGLPAWSPDGRQIAFVSDRGARWRVYVVDNAGAGTPVQVAVWGEEHPDWLLEQIAWTR